MTDRELDPEHHERQAARHLEALDMALPSVNLTVEELARLAIRAQMAQAHATLALSRRTRGAN